jgi:cytochrome b561
MPKAALDCLNGTGGAQAATTWSEGLDEHNAHPSKLRGDLDRYDGLARFLHWIFAAGIIYASIAGYTVARLSSGPERDFLSRLNMSIASRASFPGSPTCSAPWQTESTL